MSFKEKNKNQSIRRSSRLALNQYTTPRRIKQRSISLPAKSKQPKTFKKQKSSSKQHKPIKSSSNTYKSNKKKSKSTRKRFSRKKRRTKTIGQGDGTKENPYKADRNVAHYETRKQNQFDEYNDETLRENRNLKKENKKAKETIDKQNKRIEDQDNVNQSMQSVLEQQELVTNQFAIALSKCQHLHQQLKKKYDVSEMEVRKLAMELGDYLASKDNNDIVHVEVAYESDDENDTKNVYYNYGPRNNAIRKWVGYKVKVIVLTLRLRKKVNPHNMPSVIVIILETFSPGFTKDIRIPCPNTIRYWQKHFSQDLSDMALIHKLQNKEYEYQTLTNQLRYFIHCLDLKERENIMLGKDLKILRIQVVDLVDSYGFWTDINICKNRETLMLSKIYKNLYSGGYDNDFLLNEYEYIHDPLYIFERTVETIYDQPTQDTIWCELESIFLHNEHYYLSYPPNYSQSLKIIKILCEFINYDYNENI